MISCRICASVFEGFLLWLQVEPDANSNTANVMTTRLGHCFIERLLQTDARIIIDDLPDIEIRRALIA